MTDHERTSTEIHKARGDGPRLGESLGHDCPRGVLPHRCTFQRGTAGQAAETTGAHPLGMKIMPDSALHAWFRWRRSGGCCAKEFHLDRAAPLEEFPLAALAHKAKRYFSYSFL